MVEEISLRPELPSTQRRGFLAKLVALGAWIVAYLAPVGAAVRSFFAPARQKGQGAAEFTRVAPLDSLPEDGTPKKFPILAQRRDAWTVYPNEPIGQVFLRRVGKDQVVAFQAKCPHMGCGISYMEEKQSDQVLKKFYCPCHKANFDLEGRRTDAVSESPRDMDTLDEVKIEDGVVYVRFKNFRTGTAAKEEEV
ncbi:MAG TPA: Rieske 2Fe-2S domain-containing protein [Thermoguttaceae bacterium]|nr:Rieske 2Fe-2S domain-containing protein [Thermoguttaceae bacterium]HPP52519.1 Rieske 2Fe-2S domain-containing protein [Thermoguttaceae bacterium]